MDRPIALRKVACLTPLYFDERSCLGGGERYPLNLAKGVVAASGGNCTVELVSYGDAPHHQTLCPGVTLRVLPISNRPKDRLDVVSWALPAAVAEADLVHIHTIFARSGEMALLVAKQQGKPVCVTDHGGLSSTLTLELDSLELADHIISNSEFGAGLFRGGLCHCGTPVTVIKGGVDAARFAPPPDGERPSRDRVLYVGRLLPHKGIDRLIEALPPELPLTVCGRPHHEEYLRRLQSLCAGKQVLFVTDADDETIRGLYARAWATVLPSVYRDCYGNVYQLPELMGFTLLESMACGTPAIASRVGGLPEYVEHGRTGFVFDGEDDLAEYLRRLAGDPELVERLGKEAREVAVREYDLNVAGAKMYALYQELVAAAAGGAPGRGPAQEVAA